MNAIKSLVEEMEHHMDEIKKTKLILVTPIHGTAEIQIEEDERDSEEVTVYMDYNVYLQADSEGGAEYDTSDAYQIVGKGTKVKAFLSPMELKRLEDKVKGQANAYNHRGDK